VIKTPGRATQPGATLKPDCTTNVNTVLGVGSRAAVPRAAATVIPSAAISASTTAPRSASSTTAWSASPTAATWSAAVAGRGPGPGLGDHQAAAFVVAAVKLLDRRVRFAVAVHFHEAESAAPACFAIAHDLSRYDRAKLSEELLEPFRADPVGEISHIKPLGHRSNLETSARQSVAKQSRSRCADVIGLSAWNPPIRGLTCSTWQSVVL
jgi:hypothetical protein